MSLVRFLTFVTMAALADDNANAAPAAAAQEANGEKRIFEPEEDEEFDNIMDSLKDKLVILDMGAAWCGPCKALSLILPAVIKELSGFYIVKVDVDDCEDTAEKYGMLENATLPTLIFLNLAEEESKQQIAKEPGAKDKDKLMELIEKHFKISK